MATLVPAPDDPIEFIVRVMFTAADQETLKKAVRRAMARWVVGSGGDVGLRPVGRRRSAPAAGLWPALVAREAVEPHVA